MWRRWVGCFVLAAMTIASVGCGGAAQQPVTFDPGSAPTFPSTTSSPRISVPLTNTTPVSPGSGPSTITLPRSTTTTSVPSIVVPPDAVWKDVTGNLTGLSSECGTVSVVAASPLVDTVIAGIGQQGLWAASPDDTWQALGSGSGSDVVDNRPFALTFDRENAQVFWEAGGYHGGGVFKTTDGGTTFRRLGDPTHIESIAVDFTDPNRSTLLASGHETLELHRSSDGGAHWTNIKDALPPIGGITGVGVLGSQTFLIGTTGAKGGESDDGVYRSTDGGATWTHGFSYPVIGTPLVSAVDGSIYWILAQTRGVIRSTDGGASWQRVNAGAVLNPGIRTLTEMPDGTLVGVGRFGLVQSTDHAATFQAFGPNLPFNDPTGLTFAADRKAFYVSRFDCDVSVPRQPVTPASILRLDIGPSA